MSSDQARTGIVSSDASEPAVGAVTAPAPDGEALLAWLTGRRRAVASTLEERLRSRANVLAAVSPVGADLAERLREFTNGGKMLRGALVHLGAELVSAARPAGLDLAAAAMELFQAGLLVHDDIMDGDETRRGMPTFHRRYAIELAAGGAGDPARVGESLGICAGDAAFFEGFAALAEGLSGCASAPSILGLCSEELTRVALGQMDDVRWGGLPDERDEESILRMYRSKTARYTFSMPLAVGALMAAGGSGSGGPSGKEAADRLVEIGELAGQVFQIRDDELGIFGTEAEIGKPVGSDIREGKKTIWRARLVSRAAGPDAARLASIFGNRLASRGDIEWVQMLTEDLGVRRDLAALAGSLAARARSKAETAEGFRDEARPLLVGLVDWSAGRRK